MNRRGFLLLVSSPVLADNSPRNQLCTAANEFHKQYTTWAETMNASRDKSLMIPANALVAFEPLQQLWRKVEHLHRTWVRGR